MGSTFFLFCSKAYILGTRLNRLNVLCKKEKKISEILKLKFDFFTTEKHCFILHEHVCVMGTLRTKVTRNVFLTYKQMMEKLGLVTE